MALVVREKNKNKNQVIKTRVNTKKVGNGSRKNSNWTVPSLFVSAGDGSHLGRARAVRVDRRQRRHRLRPGGLGPPQPSPATASLAHLAFRRRRVHPQEVGRRRQRPGRPVPARGSRQHYPLRPELHHEGLQLENHLRSFPI